MLVNDALERLPISLSSLFWAPFLVIFVSVLYDRITAVRSPPSHIPWVGKDSSKFFAETRASWDSLTNFRSWLREGYSKYSSKDTTFVFPEFTNPEVIVPSTEMKWLIEMPEEILSVNEYHYEVLAGKYAYTHPFVFKVPFHEHVIHKVLSKRIGALVPELYDEIMCAFDDRWGTDTENWKEFNVFDSMGYIIARASNRTFLGKPACRDEKFLKLMATFAADVGRVIMTMQFIPKLLKPIVGRLISIPNEYHFRQAQAIISPVVRERLANIAKKDANPDWDWEEPNDYLTWHIRTAINENNPLELTPHLIDRRLMAVNFASLHATNMTTTNLIFDLVAHPSALEVIRQEACAEWIASKGTWNKQAMNRLVNSDSAIRESMRLSTFLGKGFGRKVMPKEGVEHKRLGWRLPYGTILGYNVWAVMRDPKIYTTPDDYDPFRFARLRKQAETDAPDDQPKEAGLPESKQLNLIDTSPIFMPFGHGRHACPGRFMVAHELKMILAYMTMYYEIEPLEKRPESTWMGSTVLPPMTATIRVRRRKAEELGF